MLALPPAVSHAALLPLGRTLFFDARLSVDGTVSCASCHRPEQAFADGRPVAQGVYGRQGTRNTPSLRHVIATQEMFWDGRRPNLEAQVLDPFINPHEHGLPDHAELLRRVRERPDYAALLPDTLSPPDDQVLLAVLAQALSAYVRSLTPPETRIDRYLFHGDSSALQPNERRGLELFRGQAQCATCHPIGPSAAPLTDGAYHSLALGFDQLVQKLGTLSIIVVETPREKMDTLITLVSAKSGSFPSSKAIGREC